MIIDRDIFGRMLMAHLRGHKKTYFIERGDGYIDFDDSSTYFKPESSWGKEERRALKLARGKVLDIGCGAGRHALALQRRGLKVTGIDSSPLAVQVCRKRGLRDARVMGIEEIGRLPRGSFGTIVMFGNNFGLFGSPARARRFLRIMRRITTPQAMILAGSLDIHDTTNPEHLAYQRQNRARGRLPGQLRLRIRYGARVGPWFDYLMASPAEMRAILRGTGWRLVRILPSGGPLYVAVIVRV
jgi:SAM-dependent methyltransferase